MPETLIPVILSGGAGTRLWPESRRDHPKPFMRLDDGQTLIGRTARRAAPLGKDIITVTGESHYDATRRVYARGSSDIRHHYLLEPMGRNTAPAIALAAMYVIRKFGPRAQILIMPADHLISDEQAFRRAVASASRAAAEGSLVTFGMQPDYPETGYGYIRKGEPLLDGVFRVDEFKEKPPLATAKEYVASGEYSWNGGMFCFQASALEAAMREHCPGIWETAEHCMATARGDTALHFDREAFASMPGESIDYAVMEKTDRAAIVPCSIGWSDIGSWRALAQTQGETPSNAIMKDCENTFVRSTTGRVVAAIGVKDLAIIDTDDALLVCPLDASQQVKDVVDQLRSIQDPRAHESVVKHHPWGVRIDGKTTGGRVATIHIEPGASYSPAAQHASWLLTSGKLDVAGTRYSAPAWIPADPQIILHNDSDIVAVVIETALNS